MIVMGLTVILVVFPLLIWVQGKLNKLALLGRTYAIKTTHIVVHIMLVGGIIQTFPGVNPDRGKCRNSLGLLNKCPLNFFSTGTF